MDELPQLINVLKGEMSLVGPRPHALAHDREFQERLPGYSRRFAMKPGITGLAQVRGFRGETRSSHRLEGRLAADLEYIECWTIASDIRLLVATLRVPLDHRG
jgi:lipopolysaccharide/colanic/teichoic acid biosynthesis glycosyltransferase